MRQFRSVFVLALVCIVVAPVHAAYEGYLEFGGRRYAVQVNGVVGKVCGGRSVQLLSPRVDGDPDRPAAKSGFLKIEKYPIEKVKKGEALGTATIVTDGESFPLDVELKGATISDALIRSNGTWTMTMSWSSCANVPKR